MAQTGHKVLVLGAQGVLGGVLARTFASGASGTFLVGCG
jgi:hypothetical protein